MGWRQRGAPYAPLSCATRYVLRSSAAVLCRAFHLLKLTTPVTIRSGAANAVFFAEGFGNDANPELQRAHRVGMAKQVVWYKPIISIIAL